MKNWLRAATAFAGAAALTLGGAVAGPAQASDGRIPVSKLNVTWKNDVPRHEDELKGKAINLLLRCDIKEVRNDKLVGPNLGVEWVHLTLTVGKAEEKTIEVGANNEARKKAAQVGIEQCYDHRGDGFGTSNFTFSTGVSDGAQALAMDQQANTDFKFKLVEGKWDGETYRGVIPDGKAPKVSIGLKLTKEGKTTTHILRNGETTVNTYVFADGASHRPSAELTESREETRITRAFTGNDLNLFSGYTGRYKKYDLTASIGDPEEAKLFRIESVEGNESDGWTVNLSSAVRKITPKAPTVADSNKCGVAGTVQLPESKYFDYEQVQQGTTVSVAALLKQDFKDKVVVEGDTKWELSVASKPCTLDPAEQLATPAAPKLINPSAADPSSCTVEPYVTIQKTEGVAYTVTANGVELKANKDGKYIYPYNSKVEVKASALDGYFFAKDAVTEWTWDSYDTAMNPACKPAQPKKKLANTGAEAASLVGLSAVLLLAGGVLTARRFK